LLGFGTWVAFGAGRVMVGLNGSDSSFDSLEETGGSKDAVVVSHNHTATSTVSDPGHIHSVTYGSASNTSNAYPSKLSIGVFSDANTNTAYTGISVATSIASTGSSGTNANLQPYITVAMWKRTA
jgi:microcystin-dependent protein